jgi:hypothetical protein
MPLLFNVVEFGNILFLALSMDFVLLKVASVVWFRTKWLVVILTFFWHKMTWFGELGSSTF